jgi:hypothetical protein
MTFFCQLKKLKTKKGRNEIVDERLRDRQKKNAKGIGFDQYIYIFCFYKFGFLVIATAGV